MRIDNPKKIIFIHINKTGGSSVTKLFSKYINNAKVHINKERGLGTTEDYSVRDKHVTLKGYSNKISNINDYFIFTIIRNPYSRALSLYYWHRNNTNAMKSANKSITYFDPEDFKGFVSRLKNPKSDDHHAVFSDKGIFQYTNLILNEKNICNKIKILKFENLNEIYEIEELKEIIGDEKIEHLNKSALSEFNYKDIYIKYPEIQEFVYNFWKKDFILLNYNKDITI